MKKLALVFTLTASSLLIVAPPALAASTASLEAREVPGVSLEMDAAIVSVTPDPCVLPDDPTAAIPSCWWELGWAVAETGICAAVVFPPAKAAKVASNVRKAIKKVRNGKKKKNGDGIDREEIRSIMTAIFGGFICADMWSSIQELTECWFRN